MLDASDLQAIAAALAPLQLPADIVFKIGIALGLLVRARTPAPAPVSSRTLLRRAALERATRFLQEELGHGPVAATKIEALAEKRGIGVELEDAKAQLGVIASRANSSKGGAHAVTYSLPAAT